MDLIDLTQRDVAQRVERSPLEREVIGSSPVVSANLSNRLVLALEGRGWLTRDYIARQLDVSVRAIREAASLSNGRIICGNSGLKLTMDATDAEIDECVGRFRSQVSEMTRRIVEIRAIQDCRLDPPVVLEARCPGEEPADGTRRRGGNVNVL